ncbi:TRAP transporter permease [Natrinema soli]|uniref:TRAP transporter permease n=1 Tax=Natrinema soli TaxID=1930624 RepID=A0ABD5SJU8_9EURY|nr:TRAP transporter fused permease subunit [Natrinema soli]
MRLSNQSAKLPSLRSITHITTIQYIIAIAFWAFVSWQTIEQGLARPLFGVIVLGGAITAYTIENIHEARQKEQTDRTGALVFSLVANVITTVYVILNFQELQTVRVGYGTQVDYVIAAVFIATILYLTYDAYGTAFVGMIVAVIFYSQFGYLFPSWLYHGGLSIERGLQVGILDFQGIYGTLTQVMGTMVAPFLLLAGLLRSFGGFGLIVRGAFWLSSRVKTGVGQMAVVSSLLIGSINGSALANTTITGSFTIPVLKSTGIKKEQAAAIEAVASSGGQIMPPVMGVAAFLMADILARPLLDIFVAAAVPALIFYLTISISVYQINKRETNTQLLSRSRVIEEIPEMREWLKSEHPRQDAFGYRLLEVLQFLIPIGVLFYQLGIARATVMRAGMFSAGTMVLTGFAFLIVSNLLDPTMELNAIPQSALSQFGNGIRDGIESLAPLTVVVAAIGLMVDTLFTTGLPATLAFALIDISGGILPVLLGMTMVLCIILGMGMPTSASYLVVALLIAPNLIDFGIPELPAHFFVLYFAILAAITPPIAPGIVIASGIADADFWKSCAEAMKIAIPVFILPFAFIYNPQLVSPNVSLNTIITAVAVITGTAILSIGLNSKGFSSRLPSKVTPVVGNLAQIGVILVGIVIMVVPK